MRNCFVCLSPTSRRYVKGNCIEDTGRPRTLWRDDGAGIQTSDPPITRWPALHTELQPPADWIVLLRSGDLTCWYSASGVFTRVLDARWGAPVECLTITVWPAQNPTRESSKSNISVTNSKSSVAQKAAVSQQRHNTSDWSEAQQEVGTSPRGNKLWRFSGGNARSVGEIIGPVKQLVWHFHFHWVEWFSVVFWVYFSDGARLQGWNAEPENTLRF